MQWIGSKDAAPVGEDGQADLGHEARDEIHGARDGTASKRGG
jgi:hypothetical protein